MNGGSAARAVVFVEAGRLDLRDVTLRESAADEVVVATKFSSISAGTERVLLDGKLPPIPHLGYPLVPGYEAAGVVTHVGDAVADIKVGDEVFVGGSMCYTDVGAFFGGQSSRLIKKAAQVIPLHGIPLVHAPLLALAATSLHGVRRGGDLVGKSVAIVGMGAIGQFAARFVATMQPALMVEADKNPQRLGRIPGAQSVDVNVQSLAEAYPGGFDVIFEGTGYGPNLANCAKALKPGGTIVLLSYYDTLETPFMDIFVKEATLVTAKEWSHADLLGARDLIANGDVSVADLAETLYPVERYQAAYDAAFGDPSTVKVILQWA